MKKNVPLRGSGNAKQLLKFLLLMKLAILLVLFTAYQVEAGVFAQTVTVNVKQTEIKKILNNIEKKGDVRFLYNYELPELKTKVDFSAENLPVRSALDKLFNNTDLAYKVLDNNLIVIHSKSVIEAIPVITVTGKITGDNGEPLAGVSIMVKGTTRGTTTDNIGVYTLSVDKDAVLVISYIGYETREVAVKGQQLLNVKLTVSSKILDQVVVVGYGTQRKALVTGAIAQVNSQQIANKQLIRLDDALRGQAAGVIVTQSNGAPGSAPNVYVRGVTSINNSTPLYVIDGVVQTGNGGIDYLNPNDIASIAVMKDAASAAIYGTQAANGVIIITTKKGANNQPMRINYDMQMGLQGPMKKIKMADATEYAELRNEAAINDGRTIPFASPAIFGTGTNWQNEIYSNNAQYQNHHISVSGGSDKATYYVAAGYIGQQGMIVPSVNFYNRFMLTSNTSFKLSKYVTIGENFSFTNEKNNTAGNTNSEYGGFTSDALNLDPITPVFVPGSTPTDQMAYISANPGVYPTANIPYLVTAPNGMYYSISPYVQQEIVNPLAYIQTQRGNYGWSDNFIGSGYIDVHPIKGLVLRSQINAKGGFWGGQSFSPFYYLSSYNNYVPSTNPSNVTNQISEYRYSDNNLTWNWDNTVSYGRQIGLHNFEVLVGTSAMRQTGSGLNVTLHGVPITNYQDFSFNWSTPNSYTVNANGSVIVNNYGAGYDNQVYTLFSYFGRVNYNYNEKYLFTGIIRRDASSKFGSDNRWGTFPSAQVGWVVTKEKFFPQNTPVDNLKIRVSYGAVGNDMSLGTYQYESLIASGGLRNAVFGNNTSYVGYGPSAPANPNLKWEKDASLDIGFDAVLFRNFTLTFDYYNKKTEGMLMQPPIPDMAGFLGAPWANVGNMTNKGVELELGYRKNFGKDFSLNVSGNIAYNKNEITYLGGGVPYINGGPTYSAVSGYNLTQMTVGHSVGEFYGFKELGTFKSQAEINSYGYTDANGFHLYQPNAVPGDLKFQKNPNNSDSGQGTINNNDRIFLGDALPHWIYGLNLSFSWKNWDLAAFGQGVWGNDIFQAFRRMDVGIASTGGAANYTADALNAWTVLNPNSNYPRITDNDPNGNYTKPSNFYLQSGAYFRLKTLTIGYTFPKAWMNTIKFQNIRIYASVNNLFTATKYNGIDPEVGGNLGAGASGQNNGNYGVDYGLYPQARTFILGLNVGL